MADTPDDNEDNYEIYEADSDMFCVVGIDNIQSISQRAPGTKARYKQSYREVWESMRDFKGWLTSVPGNTSKAYCKLCQKELHCHRLSLLKHKVTFKHQKKEEEHKLNQKNKVNIAETKSKMPKDEVSIKVEYDNEISTNLEPAKATSAVDDGVNFSGAATSESCDDILHNETVPSKGGPISTQITDLSKGQPGASIHVVLYKLIDGRWTLIDEGLTNKDGQYNQFFSNSSNFSPGRYKLHFDVDKYYEHIPESLMFPFIEIAFDVKNVASHYHIPLLLSPFGYSTYKAK